MTATPPDEGPVRRLRGIASPFHKVERRQNGDDFIRDTYTTLHTIRWPRLVGGPLNRQDAPPVFLDGGMLEAVEIATTEDVPEFGAAGPIGSSEKYVYVQHPLQFGVDDLVLRVEALVWESMPTTTAVKYVLLEAFGVPGMRS